MPDVQAFIIYGHPDHIVTPLSLKLLPKHEWDTSIAALEPEALPDPETERAHLQ